MFNPSTDYFIIMFRMAGAGDVTVPQLFTELQKSIQKNDHKLGVYILISSENSDWIYS